jgi:hypothetical protein
MEECSWSMKIVSYPADLARRDDVDGGDSERLGNFSKPLGRELTQRIRTVHTLFEAMQSNRLFALMRAGEADILGEGY